MSERAAGDAAFERLRAHLDGFGPVEALADLALVAQALAEREGRIAELQTALDHADADGVAVTRGCQEALRRAEDAVAARERLLSNRRWIGVEPADGPIVCMSEEQFAEREGRIAALEEYCREIVALSAGWDEDGSLGPRSPLSWESVGRVAMDYARAALLPPEVPDGC